MLDLDLAFNNDINDKINKEKQERDNYLQNLCYDNNTSFENDFNDSINNSLNDTNDNINYGETLIDNSFDNTFDNSFDNSFNNTFDTYEPIDNYSLFDNFSFKNYKTTSSNDIKEPNNIVNHEEYITSYLNLDNSSVPEGDVLKHIKNCNYCKNEIKLRTKKYEPPKNNNKSNNNDNNIDTTFIDYNMNDELTQIDFMELLNDLFNLKKLNFIRLVIIILILYIIFDFIRKILSLIK